MLYLLCSTCTYSAHRRIVFLAKSSSVYIFLAPSIIIREGSSQADNTHRRAALAGVGERGGCLPPGKMLLREGEIRAVRVAVWL